MWREIREGLLVATLLTLFCAPWVYAGLGPATAVITGGSIDATAIGGTTPAAGTFTTATGSTVVASTQIELSHATANTLTGSGGTLLVEGVTVLTTATGQPLDVDLTSWAAITRAAGFDTFTATPSSANLATLVTDDLFALSNANLGALSSTSVFSLATASTASYLRLLEDTDNGTNYIEFIAPATIGTNRQCILQDSGPPIPDSCVGDGSDAGGAGSQTPWTSNIDAATFSLTDTTPTIEALFSLNIESGASLTTADAGAVGVVFKMHHNSATPADGDIAADIQVFAGADDEEVGRIALEVDDGATTTEDTRWRVFTDVAGASVEGLTIVGDNVTSLGDFTSTDDVLVGDDVSLSGATPAVNLTDTDTNADSRINANSANGSLGLEADFNNEVANSTFFLSVDGTNEAVLNGTNFNPGADGGNSLGASGTEWLAASIDTVTVTTLELGGAATTDTSIARSAAGEATIEGDAIKHAGKQTIWIPAAAMTTQVTNGCAAALNETATNDIMFPTKNCDTTTQEGVQWNIGMPKSWNEGTVTYQVFWSHPSTVTNFGVEFDMACGSLANDAAMDTALGTPVEIGVDTGGTTDDVYVTAESGAVTCATAAADTQTFFRLRRVPADAGDTLAVDARIHGVKVLYTDDASTDE